MARREQNSLPIGREVAARRPSPARANPLRPASGQRLRINLVERIIERLGLIDDLLSIRRKVPFARFHKAARHLADVRKELAFDRVFSADYCRSEETRQP